MSNQIIAKNKEHLEKLIKQEVRLNGNECNVNHIDTSLIIDMSALFDSSKFNGDMSEWNVSNVTNMNHMFADSSFNKDISNWNVSSVEKMYGMFLRSKFNGNISKWDVSNVTEINYMFLGCKIEKPWWAIEDKDQRKEALEKYQLMQKLNETLINKEKIIQSKKNKI